MALRALLLVLLTALAGPATAAPPGQRILVAGPALAGGAVVWGEQTGALHLWTQAGGDRVVYRDATATLVGALSASRALVAFERSRPTCPQQPGVVCPVGGDALAGPPRGPFRQLMPLRRCTMASEGGAVAVEGDVAAYEQLDCGADRLRVEVRDFAPGGRTRVLRDLSVADGCCAGVRLAGRFVAWTEGRDGVVVVHDLAGGKTPYRIPLHGAGGAVDFDVQADGKVAVADGARVGWFAPGSRIEHVLPFRTRGSSVRIANDRILVERALRGSASALVVADLAGGTRRIARFAPPIRRFGGFDFDGNRVTWASKRVTSSRVDCGPPGTMRPCVRLESGVIAIWTRAETGPAERVLAVPFEDLVRSE